MLPSPNGSTRRLRCPWRRGWPSRAGARPQIKLTGIVQAPARGLLASARSAAACRSRARMQPPLQGRPARRVARQDSAKTAPRQRQDGACARRPRASVPMARWRRARHRRRGSRARPHPVVASRLTPCSHATPARWAKAIAKAIAKGNRQGFANGATSARAARQGPGAYPHLWTAPACVARRSGQKPVGLRSPRPGLGRESKPHDQRQSGPQHLSRFLCSPRA